MLQAPAWQNVYVCSRSGTDTLESVVIIRKTQRANKRQTYYRGLSNLRRRYLILTIISRVNAAPRAPPPPRPPTASDANGTGGRFVPAPSAILRFHASSGSR